MSENQELEVYRQHRAGQDKYVYFMLAAAASAVAYALNRAQDRYLTLSLIPWGIALLLWGLSFYFGCMNLLYVSSTLYANIVLFTVQNGEEPSLGNIPWKVEAASEGIRAAIKTNIGRASWYGRLQFFSLISGSLAYITWQVWEMYLRIPKP